MSPRLESIVGPRVPPEEWRARRSRYLLPTLLLQAAGLLLVVSFFLPYWHMTLHAPQYPDGLRVSAFLNRLSGDVSEIDGLNHYIGMRPLNEAAQLERANSAMLIGVLALLLLAAVFVHNRNAAWLALPTILFPVGFLADLHYWLASFGRNLDPKAALSGAVKPFVPPVLGEGLVGQFRTVAEPGSGLLTATGAAVLTLIALWFHRRAYKALVEAKSGTAESERCEGCRCDQTISAT